MGGLEGGRGGCCCWNLCPWFAHLTSSRVWRQEHKIKSLWHGLREQGIMAWAQEAGCGCMTTRLAEREDAAGAFWDTY